MDMDTQASVSSLSNEFGLTEGIYENGFGLTEGIYKNGFGLTEGIYKSWVLIKKDLFEFSFRYIFLILSWRS